MFKIKEAQEAITIILTSAMSAGGFYLLTFVMCALITSPMGLLFGVLLLNILSIWYHLSSLYTRVFSWTYKLVGTSLYWLDQRPVIHKLRSHARRTKKFVGDKLQPVFNFIKNVKSKLFKKSDEVSEGIQIINAEFIR